MSRRRALCVAKSCGDGFIVCRDPFACVTYVSYHFFNVFEKGHINLLLLPKMEIVAIGFSPFAVTMADNLLL